jgi:hypothetical protein
MNTIKNTLSHPDLDEGDIRNWAILPSMTRFGNDPGELVDIQRQGRFHRGIIIKSLPA